MSVYGLCEVAASDMSVYGLCDVAASSMSVYGLCGLQVGSGSGVRGHLRVGRRGCRELR